MQVCCGEDDLKTETIKTQPRRLELRRHLALPGHDVDVVEAPHRQVATAGAHLHPGVTLQL